MCFSADCCILKLYCTKSRFHGIMNRLPFSISLLFFIIISLVSCTTVGVFEKNVAIPNHQWQSEFQPVINFDITDTSATYNVYIVMRHTNKYGFNNIWVRAKVKEPGSQQWKTGQYDLTLADNNRGWLGSGMDDIFEHRILVQQQTKFLRTGNYEYSIQQIMREDPLPEVMNIGLRIEKAP